jgi:hypothetical protein
MKVSAGLYHFGKLGRILPCIQLLLQAFLDFLEYEP